MTDNDKALVERLRKIGERVPVPCPDGIKGCLVFHFRVETDPTCAEAADRIEALEAENERLREAFERIADGTMPRPLGEPWRMDMTSSKHDRCVHGAWMYEPCEGCIDAFIASVLERKDG